MPNPFKKRTRRKLEGSKWTDRIRIKKKSHKPSWGGHKQHPEMEKPLEFVGAQYDDLKGLYVVAKKDLKAVGELLNFLSAPVDEMAIEIANLVQHSYSFNKVVGVPAEIAETGSKSLLYRRDAVCAFSSLGL